MTADQQPQRAAAPATAPAAAGGAASADTQQAAAGRSSKVKFVGGDEEEDGDEDDDDDDEEDEDMSDDDDDDDDKEDDTDTYIALPDGPVAPADIDNPLVSRIGGPPAFLPLRTLPPFPATTICPNPACAQPMELLLQIFAPREDSPYDRCLHVWGCSRRTCNAPGSSRQAGTEHRPSIRVLRTLTFNPRWAAKLAKEKARREEKERAKAEQAQARQQTQASDTGKNPFSMQGAGAAGSGGLFGGDSDDEDDEDDEDGQAAEDEDDEEAERAERLAEELQIKATLDEHRRIRAERRQKTASATASSGDADDQIWPDAADVLAYRPPQYLNTIPEPYAEDADDKAVAAKAKAADGLDGGVKAGGSEGYERQLLSGITSTFERFLDRVRREPSQVLRYAWDGEPLPYANRLVEKGVVGKAEAVADSAGANNNNKSQRKKVTVLDPPPCERCGAPRTFELQLMPNLINLLKPSTLSQPNGRKAASAPADASQTAAAADAADLEAEKADVGYTPLERAERARQREIARALGRAPTTTTAAGGGASASTAESQPPTSSSSGSGGGGAAGRAIVGLGWATAWVYVCSADCCRPPPRSGEPAGSSGEDNGPEETWAEEWVALEFEQL